MQLIHDLGKSLALIDPATGAAVWRYVYSGAPKPYFHPVCTPSGSALTNFEPHDHVWHRGMWFAIKYINNENFWEEKPPFGTQCTIGMPAVSHADQQISLYTDLEWIGPDGKTRVFYEQRQINYEPMGPDAYAIDFFNELVAQSDLTLDRTPYTTWGGYGGLILRGTRNWQRARHLFPDGSTSERPTGQRHAWCDLCGQLDGGPNRTGGFAMFDHPANPRHPSPWYGGGKDVNYTNAAFLFHEPMFLDTDQSLIFRYRVLIHDGTWAVERLQAAYEAFVAQTAIESEEADLGANAQDHPAPAQPTP
jgi:hypothetical protein